MEINHIDAAKREMFETMPIPKAVLKNALPSIVGMLMALVYNLADTFFIAQTGDDLQVAAVSLAMPVFMIFMSFGNLFGAGGASVISRALGAGRTGHASKVSAFCIWSCIGMGTLIAFVLLSFISPILRLIGTSAETEGFTRSYLTIVAFCGPLLLFSNCCSSIIRSEGKASISMIGMLIGNIANIILDPIFILLFDMGIAGAAIATVIGNVLSAAHYLLYFFRKQSLLKISPKHFSVRDKILSGVISIGIPASIGQLLMSASHIFANGVLATYSDNAVAALGVSMRIMIIIGTACIGLGQGTQPLLGYCIGGRLTQRYKGIFRFSLCCAILIATAVTGVCFAFVDRIVSVFLSGAEALALGIRFARFTMSTGALFGVFYLISNALQAMGAAIPTFFVSVSRQGLVYIPALFILNSFAGIDGVVWAQPAADVISTILAVSMYCFVLWRRRKEWQ